MDPITKRPRTKIPDHFALGEAERTVVDRVAERFEGNRSMAARYIITHFANCELVNSGVAAAAHAEPEAA